MEHSAHKKHALRPVQRLLLGLLCVIITGTVLLMLPISTVNSKGLPPVEALFTATSATCVTGLVVADTGTELTFFGQFVVLILLQIGGLGIMMFATLAFMMLGKRINLSSRLTLQEMYNEPVLSGVVRVTRTILFTVFTCEAVGAVLLSVRFIPLYGVARGIWYSVFHSISAFCNAGFDLIGNYQSFTAFTKDPYICLVLMILITTGGLGFAVINELRRGIKFRKFSFHTKLVLSTSLILFLFGTLSTLAAEWSNPGTLGAMPFGQKLLASSFQAVTLRTAGFNTIGQNSLTATSKLIAIILMFIGASPVSTGGGIKTTTFAMIFLQITSVIRGHRDVTLFERRVAREVLTRALAIFIISLTVLLICTCALTFIEASKTGGIMNLKTRSTNGVGA
jgi:trk system potassium uptake protein TrkH